SAIYQGLQSQRLPALTLIMSLHLLVRHDRSPSKTVIDKPDLTHDEPFEGIRCPRCAWRPVASSRWCCYCTGTPEPPFDACGAVWNTFTTKGRCPGCGHQWQWTSCHRCGEFSHHEDWYAKQP